MAGCGTRDRDYAQESDRDERGLVVAVDHRGRQRARTNRWCTQSRTPRHRVQTVNAKKA